MKVTNFFEEILYPATLLRVFISSGGIFGVTYIYYHVISYVSSETFTFLFPGCIPLISFNYPIVLARSSSTILKRLGDSGQTYLFPKLIYGIK